MRPARASEIFGSRATLLLPLDAADSIDYGLLGAEIDPFTAAKVNGICSDGGSGKFRTRIGNGFDRVGALPAEKCGGASVRFRIGACRMSPWFSR